MRPSSDQWWTFPSRSWSARSGATRMPSRSAARSSADAPSTAMSTWSSTTSGARNVSANARRSTRAVDEQTRRGRGRARRRHHGTGPRASTPSQLPRADPSGATQDRVARACRSDRAIAVIGDDDEFGCEFGLIHWSTPRSAPLLDWRSGLRLPSVGSSTLARPVAALSSHVARSSDLRRAGEAERLAAGPARRDAARRVRSTATAPTASNNAIQARLRARGTRWATRTLSACGAGPA